jgi:phage shock protein A
VIVRIAGEGQYRLPDEDADRLNELDNRAVSAVEELEAAGTFEDLTQLGSGQDDIDRQLSQLTSGAQVDDELAKMKAELGSGSGGDAPALGQGEKESAQ